MSVLIQINNVALARGAKLLFSNLNLSINTHDRLALVGHNGCGKSSLLNFAQGNFEAEEGELIRQRGLRVASVEQFVPEPLLAKTLFDSVLDTLDEEERHARRYEVEQLLNALGLQDDQFNLPLSHLSGGQQNLALIARAQLAQPQLLLMDEPGNHMDVLAIECLKNYLNQAANLTYVMISHDRELLDSCCNKTIFLRDQTAYSFDLPFSQAMDALIQKDEQTQARRSVQDKEIHRIRASAKRLSIWGRTYDNEKLARKAKSMAAKADRLEEERVDVSQGSGLSLFLNTSVLRANTIVSIDNMKVTIPGGGSVLCHCEHLVIEPGDRVGLLGVNGSGKSSTINRLLSALDLSDEHVRFNPNVELGYFDQELADFSGSLGRFDWLMQRSEATEGQVKKILIDAGVTYQQFGQVVSSLSGGEKARLMFMLLSLKQPNFLVLDEPTNHIDLQSRQELEEALINSQASMLITSHDRQFLETVCNRFCLIHEQVLREIHDPAKYYDSIAQRVNLRGGVDHKQPKQGFGSSPGNQQDLDKLLDQIAKLEELLEADLQRKPKFQKPNKQAQWRAELELLWQEVERLDAS